MKYSDVMARLTKASDKKLEKDINNVKEIAAKRAREIVDVVRIPGGPAARTRLILPLPSTEFNQTFNEGRFKTLGAFLGSFRNREENSESSQEQA